MSIISTLFEYILHIDKYLGLIIDKYGVLSYLILFLIIFCETGLVVTPILPGDSMLFAAGALWAASSQNIVLLFFILVIAAILGDTVNYHIGYFFGPKLFNKGNTKFFKKEYLDKTHAFYEKHGGKTIIIARFIPIIRTFAPFVAGMGSMSYLKFITYNIVGGILWVALFVFGGYFFGNHPVVKDNFGIVIIAIIFISLLPAIIEFIKHKYSNKKIR